jgi:hypothetical protein
MSRVDAVKVAVMKAAVRCGQRRALGCVLSRSATARCRRRGRRDRGRAAGRSVRDAK